MGKLDVSLSLKSDYKPV